MSRSTVAESRVAAQEDGALSVEYRYPGSPPFADTELGRLVFHGRGREIDEVLHSILSFDLLVVYAISGLGKTSLLSAGVFERLREHGLFPVMMRLNDPATSPVELIDSRIREAGLAAPEITVMRSPVALALADGEADLPVTGLWDLLGTLEIWRDNALLRPVLVFDQFEELFTLGWDDAQRAGFIADLGQVIRRHRSIPDGGDPSTDALAAVPPPNVKIVLIIREDFLGELEALAADVPTILAHRFRLDALHPDQAKAAICEPAAVDDDRLASPRFRYTDPAAQAIVEFLGARQAHGRAARSGMIDPCQLQLICQHVERAILPERAAGVDADVVVEITEADLGGRDGLERILSDFYRREVLAFAPRQRRLVRALCETGLINQNRRRLSLEEGEIADRFHVDKAMLDALVSRRLLRSEPRVGSVYYELAHDSLTTPILAYRDAQRAARRRRVRWWIAGMVGLALAVVAVVAYEADDGAEPQVVARPVDIGSGEVLEGSMTANAFHVEVDRSQPLQIEVTPNDGEDLTLQVTYPSGATEEVRPDADSTIRHVVLATALGTYHLDVTGTADATFGLTVQPSPSIPPVVIDEAISELITDDAPRRTFEFAPTDDRPVELAVVPSPQLDVVLEVTGPDGVASRIDQFGKGLEETFAMSGIVDGPFIVDVSAAGSTGTFELSATPLPLVTIEPGKPHRGRIDEPGDIVVIEIDQPSGSFTLVELFPSASLDGVIEVEMATSLQPDTSDSGGAGNPEVTVVPNFASRRSRAIVTGYDVSTGAFDLRTSPVPVSTATVGHDIGGVLSQSTPVVVYEVRVDDAGEYELALEADDELDASATVISEAGDFLLTTNDATSGGLPAGTFWVGVASEAHATGGFELRLTRTA